MTKDRSDCQQIEDSLKVALDYAENIIATLREPFVVLNRDLRVKTANRSFFESFHVSKKKQKIASSTTGQRTMGHSPPPNVAESSPG